MAGGLDVEDLAHFVGNAWSCWHFLPLAIAALGAASMKDLHFQQYDASAWTPNSDFIGGA